MTISENNLVIKSIESKSLTYSNLLTKDHYSTVRIPNHKSFTFVGRGFGSPKCNTFVKYTCECGHIVKVVHNSCKKLQCPICYQESLNLNALRTSKRFKDIKRTFRKSYRIKLKYFHISFNTMYPITDFISYKKYKKKLITILRKEGLHGSLVFHAWRHINEYIKINGCYVKDIQYNPKVPKMRVFPHFHFIGTGYLINSDQFKSKYGFTYTKMENPRTRIERLRQEKKGILIPKVYEIKNSKEIYSLIHYLLSHSAIINNTHTLTWFGAFSYNQLQKTIIKEVKLKELCPKCHSTIKFSGVLEYSEGSLTKTLFFNDNIMDYSTYDFDMYKGLVSMLSLKLPFEISIKYEKINFLYRGNIDFLKKDLLLPYQKKIKS